MKIALKNLPKLRLSDLLRRRKMTLVHYLAEFGITTYEGLVSRCDRMGIAPPSEEDFKKVMKPLVNNPQEGVVVLDPMVVIDDLSGREIDPDAPILLPVVEVRTFSQPEENNISQKKLRKKKDVLSTE